MWKDYSGTIWLTAEWWKLILTGYFADVLQLRICVFLLRTWQGVIRQNATETDSAMFKVIPYNSLWNYVIIILSYCFHMVWLGRDIPRLKQQSDLGPVMVQLWPRGFLSEEGRNHFRLIYFRSIFVKVSKSSQKLTNQMERSNTPGNIGGQCCQ